MTTKKPPVPSLRAVAEAAMRANGFEPDFSPAVLAEVRGLDEADVQPEGLKVRLDQAKKELH